MKHYKLLMVLVVYASLMCSVSYGEYNAASPRDANSKALETASEKDPNAAPLFVLRDPNGKEVKLGDLKGKIVVLEWFNYDCPFVVALHKSELPIKMVQKYDPKKVVWLAINSTHYATPEDTQKFITDYKLTYPVLMDPGSRIGKLYKAKTTPQMFVVDKDGAIAYQGAIDNAPFAKKPESQAYVNYVEMAVDELLAGKPVTTPQTKPYGCSVKYPPTEKPAEKSAR